MNAEIEKAVAAGKLTPAAGRALEQLQPGTYCTHKSWGFGRIDSVNFLISQITIHFKGKKGHTMQLQYAADSLEPIAPDHILAHKASDASAIKARAKDDPIGLMRQVVMSFGGRATQDQITQTFVPEIFSENEFKRWWEATKTALKKDGHFAIPARKTEPITLRDAPVSHATQFLAAFTDARQLKDQLAALEQIAKNLNEFSDPAGQLQPILVAAEEQARKNQRLNTAKALELLAIRDEILEKSRLPKNPQALSIAQILRDEERRLAELIGELPAARHKRVLNEFPATFGDEWVAKALSLMNRGSTRVVAEGARLLEEKGQVDALRAGLDRVIREHSITSEVLCWLCKEREGALAELMSPRLLNGIIGALERDQFNESKRGRLQDLLLSDKELVPDLIAHAAPEDLRDVMRRIILTPVFEELNKRSLLGRIIRIHPELQAMVSGESGEKQEALVVSWGSLEKRRAELDEVIRKKIPENIKEISVARSYGDLRENFEFKAAKEMQRVLARRRAEMERDLSRARGTDFANPDVTKVSIGTVVTLREIPDGPAEVYTVLGAWDGDPGRSIISYQAAVAQAILGHKPGEQINFPTEHGDRLMEIVSIEAYQPSGAESSAEVAEVESPSAG